jgi:hypothetical protein
VKPNTNREINGLFEIQRSDRLDRVDHATKNPLHVLFENRTLFTDSVGSRALVIERLHSETLNHVTFEANKTRKKIIEMLLSYGADPHAIIKEGAEKITASTIIAEVLADSQGDSARIQKLLQEKKK